MAPVLLIILFTCLIFEQSHGLGHLAVRLRSYDNEAGELDNGHCCDGKWGVCSSKCDYYFHICLDAPDGSPSVEECAIGSEITDHLHNEDNIDFTDEIGDTPNPIVFDFTEWPVPLHQDILSFKMKIDVWDADSVGDDDFVDYFSEQVSTFPDPVNTQVYLLSERTSLVVEVRLWCEEDWYGLNCSVYCSPPGDVPGHYDCSHNGDKICHPGWTGADCTEDIQECASEPCQNGATCVDGINNFHCVCPYGYSGVFCETITDPCVLEPCLNGASCQAISDLYYNCVCMPGFIGSHCETDVSECEEEPCLNGGSCIDGINSYTCLCPPGYTGINCQNETSGNGFISVDLVSYDNEESLTDNGRFCDGLLGIKQSQCDHYFTICLDDVDGDYSMENCVLGTGTTGAEWNRDVILFTDDIGGTSNPILFSGTFSRFTGDMRIKVEVWDSDNVGRDEFVDFLTETVNVDTGLRGEDANATTVIMQGRTRLVALVKAWCADDWYGEECSVYCSLEDVDFGDLLQDGGYECNEDGELTFIPAIFGGEEYYP